MRRRSAKPDFLILPTMQVTHCMNYSPVERVVSVGVAGDWTRAVIPPAKDGKPGWACIGPVTVEVIDGQIVQPKVRCGKVGA